ncbi:MAG: MoaD/ThiS family protein [Methanomicrobiales archaeon]
MNGHAQLYPAHTMKIILPDSTIQEIPGSPASVLEILNRRGINPAEVIVSRNGKLVPEDAVARGDDEIRIIRIAHGG